MVRRPGEHAARIFRFALKFSLTVLQNRCQIPTRTIGNHMYLSLGKAAKEAGVAKSTISKALSSGKLSYREKNSDGYKIDPAELFRVYPKTTKTDADEPLLNDWQTGQADTETMPYSAKFEIQLAGLKSLIGEKDRRITDLEADRAQLREDRHRLTENWQEERVRLLKLLEDQTGTVKLLTDERSTLVGKFNARSGSGFSAASRRWRPKDFDWAPRRNGRGFGRLWGDIGAFTRPGSRCHYSSQRSR